MFDRCQWQVMDCLRHDKRRVRYVGPWRAYVRQSVRTRSDYRRDGP